MDNEDARANKKEKMRVLWQASVVDVSVQDVGRHEYKYFVRKKCALSLKDLNICIVVRLAGN